MNMNLYSESLISEIANMIDDLADMDTIRIYMLALKINSMR
jgi:hypothetical protein